MFIVLSLALECAMLAFTFSASIVEGSTLSTVVIVTHVLLACILGGTGAVWSALVHRVCVRLCLCDSVCVVV